MISQLIYIDGELLDLYKEGSKKFIAVNVEGFNIGDLTVRDANSTNRLTVPPTSNNKRLLGVNDEHSSEITPYRKKKATVIQNGVETVSNGTAIVLGFNGIDYEISILSGVYDLFQIIENKNVDDIDFGVCEVIDDTYIASICNATNIPFSAPLIDFGTLFPSKQVINNSTFINDINPWSNANRNYPLEGTDDGSDWEIDVGTSHVQFLSTPIITGLSKALRLKYRFFKNFTYRVEVTAVFLNDEGTGLTYDEFNVDARTLNENSFIHIINELNVPVGTQSLESTFTPTIDYEFLEITAASPVVSLGFSAYVTLYKIKVTDVSGYIDIQSLYYIPVANYSMIIENIITNAGFSLSLNMKNQAYYEKLFISYSKSKYEYPKRLIETFGFNYSALGTQSITLTSTTKQNIEFVNKSVLGSKAWYNELDTYSPKNIGYNFELVVRCTIIVTATISGGDTIGIFFRLDGSTQTQEETITTTGLHVFTFESDVIDAGMASFTFDVSANRATGSGSNTLVISAGTFNSDINLKAYDTINLSALIFPTISQSDFLADFFYRFGILAEERNNIIYLTESDKSITDRNYKDWTLKRDRNIRKAISYDLNGYAQENLFTDIENQDVIIQKFNSSIDIDNDTLIISQEYYRSIMSAIEQNINNGLQLCRIPIFDRTQDDGKGNYDPNPRLMYLRQNLSSDPVTRYAGVITSDFLVGVYNDPLSEFKTTWEYFLNNYYPNLTSALQKYKVTTDYFNLDETDIVSTSISDLIFDNGVYYLLVKINNFIPNQKTKVDLFKIS